MKARPDFTWRTLPALVRESAMLLERLRRRLTELGSRRLVDKDGYEY
jgi:hypothetical protein